jgi:hypothetical protein
MVRTAEIDGKNVIEFRRIVVNTQEVYRFVTVPA